MRLVWRQCVECSAISAVSAEGVCKKCSRRQILPESRERLREESQPHVITPSEFLTNNLEAQLLL
jgi:hypothetical protein